MSETQPDISDKSWNDLMEADYDLLRDVAKVTEGVRGDGSREEIAAGLLAADGREDEVPEEHRELLDGDGDDESQDQDGDEETDEDEGFTRASEYEPDRDETFIIEAGPLQTWVEHIHALVDEAKIHLTRDAIRTRAVDPANVGMVKAELYAGAFESFDVPQEGVIGVNMIRFSDVLNGANADDLVHITYESTTRNLVVEYGGHEFTLALIDPESIRKEPDLPDLDLAVDLTLEAASFKDAVGYADELADHVSLTTDPAEEAFTIYAEGDTDSYQGTFEDGDEAHIDAYPDDEAASLVSLEYLTDCVQDFERDQEIRLHHDQEFPIKFGASIEADDHEIGDVLYMIAPRIQSG